MESIGNGSFGTVSSVFTVSFSRGAFYISVSLQATVEGLGWPHKMKLYRRLILATGNHFYDIRTDKSLIYFIANDLHTCTN